jgi:Kef-type K+ transport system membrane component KefB
MPVLSFNSVFIIGAIAVGVPVLFGLAPRLQVPGAVLEIVAGIVAGPSVLGWVRLDPPVQVLSDLGLGMLLFLAGLEIDVARLRGPLGRLAGSAFGVSAVLAVACGFAFRLGTRSVPPLLLATVLMSTSAGLLLPMLKDADQESSRFGQLVMTAGALAELCPIVLLSLLYSATASAPADRLVSLGIVLALLVLIGLALGQVRRLESLDRLINRLADRSAQLRVRVALTLALGFGLLAYRYGFASVLGAFAAGLLVRIVELQGPEPHPQFMIKMQGIGFGFLIPIFFIATGVQFDLRAMLASPGAIALVPFFLAALLLVRGLPAALYLRYVGRTRAAAAGLFQATTLSFVIVAAQIGLATGRITPAASAALLTAALISAAVFPVGALRLLARDRNRREAAPAAAPASAAAPGSPAASAAPGQGAAQEVHLEQE